MGRVVGDDKGGGGGYREFEDKIVVRVGKKWPPGKEDLLVIRESTQAVTNLLDLSRAESRQEAWPLGDFLILKNQGHGYSNPDVSMADRSENLKTRPVPGSKPRDQN